jgi:Ser/Thr protein kinase RdoA (MazF antagonist)
VTARPPDDLTERVRAVLAGEYRVEVSDLAHLATHRNVLYRVDLADGRRLVLRVTKPDDPLRPNIDIEVAWLADLADDPELNISSPIPTPDGRLVVDFDAPRGRRACVLFTWIPGDPLGEGAGTSGYRAMGRISGRLHRHGGWRPPDPSRLRRWDRVFYIDDDRPVVIEDPVYERLFMNVSRELRRTVRITSEFIGRRWAEEEPIVVHGDLHEWNVHLHVGRAYAIDFEDTMLALPAQDIAISLHAARARTDLDRLISAFRGGYEEERRWPVVDRHELEMYWAARQVVLMNFAALLLDPDEARQYFDRVTPWLRGFLDRHERPAG